MLRNALRTPISIELWKHCPAVLLGLLLASCASPMANAQAAADPQSGAATPMTAASAAPARKKLPGVTTTVIVHDELKADYAPQSVTIGTLDGEPVLEMPASATVVTRAVLDDQNARLLNDVVKNDASIGEDYAPVGYYGDYEIRGIPIDLASGFQINGLTIAGEQDVPLENKESVEFFKGIAGIESGVASAGGLIGYVTKRPALVKSADLATDHRGTAYGATDLGRFFGSRKQVGARINLAGESIRSYVDHTDGWRAVGAGSADWHISPVAILKGDYEYQHKVQPSVCGYQLLGGTVVPDMSRLHPSTLLGNQPWALPNTFDAQNANARFDYDLRHGWKAFAAASYSHSLINDNVIYPYGCSEASCGANAVSYFFGQYGDYDIYDYRNPGELRINAQAEAVVTGNVKTGAVTHDLAAGGVVFRRSVQQPKHSENIYIGSENIYQPLQPFGPATDSNGNPIQPYARVLDEDNHQAAAILQDRLHLPGHIQLLVSGREDSLHDHNYKATVAAADGPDTGKPVSKMIWLPQYAITYNPVSTLTLYGNYSVMLSLGIQAPWWTDNSSFYLDPFFTRQLEIGAKFQPTQKLMATAAYFHMRTPFFYPKVIQAADSFCRENDNLGGDVTPGDLCFEPSGRETHDGMEANVEGKVANWMRLTASLATLSAQSDQTGTPAYDGKQILNAPRVRSAFFADLLVPHARGLHLMPGWNFAGRKEATRDDLVSVPSVSLFNLGARYMPGGEKSHVTLHLYADNILDKRYWKDTGANYGDTFIHVGAPTTVRLSAHYTF
jgi:iron complex outermembrane receptor protein